MKKKIFSRMLLAVLISLLIHASGCSTTKSIYKSISQKVKKGEPDLRKRVLIFPVIDQAGVGEKKVAEITETLIELLKKEGQLLVRKADQSIPSTVKLRSPKYSIAIDPDLAKRAEELGMNALITAVLNPFEVSSKKRGLWPFRKIQQEMEISLLVNAVNLSNGTLFLTNLETRTVKLPKDKSGSQSAEKKKKKISDQQLDKALSRLLEDQATAILRGLQNQPWNGRVLSAREKTIIINAGKDVGLTPGRVFEVFGRGDSIISASGRPLFLLGPKVGEIKTVKVMETYSSAIPLTGGTFRAGQIIRLKD